MRLLIMLTLITGLTSSLFGQVVGRPVPTNLPARPVVGRPVYPVRPGYGYGGYNYGPPESTYISAEDQRKAQKKAFEEDNAKKNSMTGKTRTTPVDTDTKNTASKSAAHTDHHPVKPVPAPTGTYQSPSAKTDVSFAKINIKNILTQQIGVAYSTDGETPEDGFSPLGLIKFVARKMGGTPKVTTMEQAFETVGTPITGGYGDFATGDLLYFNLFSKSKQKSEIFLTVAISDTEMIYSSFSHGEVVKASYNTDFWRERFAGARRLPIQK